MPLDSPAARRLMRFAGIGAGLALAGCGSSASHPHAGAAAGRQLELATTQSVKSARCSSASAPVPKGAQHVPKPTQSLDPSRRYVVRLATNCGVIEIQLAVRAAPRTTASFAYLVRRGFYDGLTFHRVAAGFVIQGGDPNGDGSGGPGYTIVERPPGNIRYIRGTVAMAKTSTDPPGASGSQFFIVTAAQAPLPAQYALVGDVVGGMEGVQAISRLPTDPPQDGAPRTPVVIAGATLSSS